MQRASSMGTAACVASACLLTLLVDPAVCPGNDGAPSALWLEPKAQRSVGILPWERSSTSPFGGSRIGGVDRRSFAISPDGKLLATQDAGGWQLELWSLDDGTSLGRFGRIQDPVEIAFAPDGTRLVSASFEWPRGGSVELWNVQSRELIQALDEGVNFALFTSAAFSPDGKLLALAARSRSQNKPAIHLWDAASGAELRRIEESAPQPAARRRADFPIRIRRERPEPFGTIAFAPDGRSLAVVCDERITLLELASGSQRAVVGWLPPRLPSATYELDKSAARAATFSVDGRLLAVGCHDGLIRLYDLISNRALLPLSGHAGGVVALRALADGRTLLSFGLDNRLCVWDLDSARRATPPPPSDLSAEVSAALWKALTGDDLQAVHRAQLTLAASTNGAVRLAERIQPVPPVDGARIAALVAALDSEDYNTRHQAARELRGFGELALPALRSAETTLRSEIIGEMVRKWQAEDRQPDHGPQFRAIDALGQSGNDAAMGLLADLAKGAPESPLTQRAAQSLAAAQARPASAASEATVEKLWGDLSTEDAERAWEAIRALAARPDAAQFLRDKLQDLQRRLAHDAGPQQIARLIEQLDADSFAVREAANEALLQLGQAAHPALRDALAKAASAEVRQRIQKLLQAPGADRPSGPRLQAERAQEALTLAMP